MTLPAQDTGEKAGLTDLFDLPADAPASVWSEPEDEPLAGAGDFRSQTSRHALTATEAAAPDAAEDAPTSVAPRIRTLGWLWIALGVLAAVNVVILTIPFSFRDAPASTGEKRTTPAEPAAAVPPAEPGARTIAARAPAVPTDHSALVAARAALRAAEADLIAGRRAAVRARLGRLLLAIDAVEPLERDEVHAAAALLVARSLQADADAARGSKAEADAARRTAR